MSYIKDYPCPNCGANLFKVGFMHTRWDGYETTNYTFNRGHIKTYTDTTFHKQYIKCNRCGHQLNENPDGFIKMIKEEWE